MIDYSSFQAHIENTPFTNKNGITFSKKAIISFYDKNKKNLIIKEYGYLNSDEIFKKIDRSEPLLLDQCYIKNFTLSDYKKSRKLTDDNIIIQIEKITASESIFHADSTTDFSNANILDGNINFSNTLFLYCDLSFQATSFGKGEKKFSNIIMNQGKIDFSHADFNEGNVSFDFSQLGIGVINFQFATFGQGDVSFANVNFNHGDVSFVNTNFHEGDVIFRMARFGKGEISFRFAKFGNGNISFEKTDFNDGKISFSAVECLNNRINFNRSVFGNCIIDFEGFSQKKGKFNFKKVFLRKGALNFSFAEMAECEIYFDETSFGEDEINFYKSKFSLLSLKNCHIDHYLDLRVRQTKFIDLSNVIARDIIDVKPHDEAVCIDCINFDSMRLIGLIYLDWKANKIDQLIYNQGEETTLNSKAEQFRMLKQSFNTIGQYEDEDKSYVEFKRLESRDKLQQTVTSNKNIFKRIWQYLIYYLKMIIFDKMGLYATNPIRVLSSIFIVYFSFSLLYILLVPFNVGSVLGITNSLVSTPLLFIANVFYFSGVTFLTIGYGDFTPTELYRIIAIIEGFTGVFLMSYFTVAFVRKISR